MLRISVFLCILCLLIVPTQLSSTEHDTIIQYYLDEAGSGTGPVAILDASSTQYHLPILYGTGNANYTTTNNNRGFELTSLATTALIGKWLGNESTDKIRSIIHGAKQLTFEFVVRVDTYNASCGRIFGLQDSTKNTGQGPMITACSQNVWEVRVNNIIADTFILNASTRTVVHVVIDTTQAIAADRIKVYQNGSLISSTLVTQLALNAPITLVPDMMLVLFNRPFDNNRSWDGVIYEAAMYKTAFIQSRIQTHATTLLARDDNPFSLLPGKITNLNVNLITFYDALLTWAPNSESDLAGYNVYRGTASRIYGPSILTVGKTATSVIVPGLKENTKYYFALTAFDESGNESAFSEEVSITKPIIP